MHLPRRNSTGDGQLVRAGSCSAQEDKRTEQYSFIATGGEITGGAWRGNSSGCSADTIIATGHDCNGSGAQTFMS
jgi:hypothetical protein